MKIKTRVADPVKQPDGRWKVVIREIEEEVPPLGREELMCNFCGFGTYPECKSWCKAYLPQIPKSMQHND